VVFDRAIPTLPGPGDTGFPADGADRSVPILLQTAIDPE